MCGFWVHRAAFAENRGMCQLCKIVNSFFLARYFSSHEEKDEPLTVCSNQDMYQAVKTRSFVTPSHMFVVKDLDLDFIQVIHLKR